MRVVLSLFRKTVAQPCKPLHRHAHGEILSLDGGNWIRNSSSVPPSVVSRVAEIRNPGRGDGLHRSSFRLTAGGNWIRNSSSALPSVVSRVSEIRNPGRGDGSHRSSFRLTARGEFRPPTPNSPYI